jgi:hypothetical protein
MNGKDAIFAVNSSQSMQLINLNAQFRIEPKFLATDPLPRVLLELSATRWVFLSEEKIVVAMTKDTGDTDYWRQRAAHMRSLASSIGDLSIRQKIEDIADVCDRMAEWIRKAAAQYSNVG